MDTSGLLALAAERLGRAGIERPRMEAELLLAHTLGATRLAVIAGLAREPDEQDRRQFDDLVSRREAREPLAYLRRFQEFYGLELKVTPAVLIPRPETELLVDFALERLRDQAHPVVADIGTGSGCIAVAVSARAPHARVLGIDLSFEAVRIARENAVRHGAGDRSLFFVGRGLSALAPSGVDIILSNPPYIPSGDIPGLQPEVRDYEPRLALDGGADGLDVLRSLAAASGRVLKAGGWLATEVARGQAEEAGNLLRRVGLTCVERISDHAGIPRVVFGRWSG